MSHKTNIDTNEDEGREVHISTAVDIAIANLRKMHSKSRDMCDVAYITGTMREAAKGFDSN